jgi:GNAT superfamily N-acetyltransferase
MSDGELRFRRACRQDVQAIVRLLASDPLGLARETTGEGELPDAYWQAFDAIDADPPQFLVVAELGGRVVGTLQLTFIPSLTYRGGERAQIEAVRIDAGSRDRGLGHAMVGWAIQQARARGCRLVHLTTDQRRPDALRFYETLGVRASHTGMKLLLPEAHSRSDSKPWLVISWLLGGLSLVVAGAGAGLMSASPERPAQPMAEVTSGTDEQRREQMLNLVACQWGQPGRRRVAGRFGTGGHHQEGVGEHGQGGPAIPGAPAGRPDAGPGRPAVAGLEAFLNGPAASSDPDQGGQRGRSGRPAVVEGQLAGLVVAARQQPVLVSLAARSGSPWSKRTNGPVVQTVAFGAAPGRDPRSGPRRDPPEQGVDPVGVPAGDHPVIAGHHQHIADVSGFKLGSQVRVSAVTLVAGDPGGRHAGVQHSGEMVVASLGLVANPTCLGTPAAYKRSQSSIQARGRYSSRSIMACPASVA